MGVIMALTNNNHYHANRCSVRTSERMQGKAVCECARSAQNHAHMHRYGATATELRVLRAMDPVAAAAFDEGGPLRSVRVVRQIGINQRQVLDECRSRRVDDFSQFQIGCDMENNHSIIAAAGCTELGDAGAACLD